MREECLIMFSGDLWIKDEYASATKTERKAADEAFRRVVAKQI
jgi:hypothetical protein